MITEDPVRLTNVTSTAPTNKFMSFMFIKTRGGSVALLYGATQNEKTVSFHSTQTHSTYTYQLIIKHCIHSSSSRHVTMGFFTPLLMNYHRKHGYLPVSFLFLKPNCYFGSKHSQFITN